MNKSEFLKSFEKTKSKVLQYANNKRPLVSVTIATYQHTGFINKCLDGVVNQITNFEIEILVGDDYSDDGTFEICLEYSRKYPQLITLVRHPRMNNIKIEQHYSGRFNSAYNLFFARGKYIAICEGDDYWTNPYKLQKQIEFLESNSDYTICFHKVNILKPSGEITKDFITKIPAESSDIYDLAKFGNYIHTPSVVIRNVFEEMPKEYFESPLGDYFLYMLAAQHGKIKYLDDTMAIYRHGVGIWSSQERIQIIKKSLLTYSLLRKYFRRIDNNKIALIFQKKISLLIGNFITKEFNKNRETNIDKIAATLFEESSKPLRELIIHLLQFNDIKKNDINIKAQRNVNILSSIFRKFYKTIVRIFK
jgi:glycosyltransferase involved in cell wall biosynthesis